MNKLIIIFLVSTLSYFSNLRAQRDLRDSLQSNILNETRYLRVHLPKSYDNSKDKEYPLVLVFDAEMLYYFTTGHSEILYDEDPDYSFVPETIIVGINQAYPYDNIPYSEIRGKDAEYEYIKKGFQKSTGEQFILFIENELLPYLDNKYRIGKYKSIIGYSLTASIVNNLLLNNNDLFNSYVAISPSPFNEESFKQMQQIIEKIDNTKLYYISTARNDKTGHLSFVNKITDSILHKSANKKFHYLTENLGEEHHQSLILKSLGNAFIHLFS
jgi:predicted alpha/beta superfamily hydrolase